MLSKSFLRNLIILLLVPLLVLAGGIYAYFEYNRRNPKMADVESEYTLTMQEAMHAFNVNADESQKKYVGKVLEISGRVVGVEKEDESHYTLVMGTENNMTSIRCVVDSLYSKQASAFVMGDSALIRGECVGYNADDMGLGSDLLLNRCYPEKVTINQ